MSIFDLDNYTDVVFGAVDAIGDAGELIGRIPRMSTPSNIANLIRTKANRIKRPAILKGFRS